MAEFNIDDVLSKFGEKSKAAKTGNFDVDSILSQFNEPKVEAKKDDIARDYSPKPPISGVSKEESDNLNQTMRLNKGGENPRPKLPRTNIGESISENFKSGKDLIGSGLEDLNSGHPYKGAGKVALGSLATITSPLTGTLEGGVATPVTDITGNKDIGDRAAFVAGSAIPLDMGASKIVRALPKNKALSQLVEHIGKENLPAAVAAMKSDPRIAPADLSARVLQDTQNLFVTEGPHINYLKNTSDARMAGRKNAIEEAYDASGGTVSQDLAQKVTDLANSAKKVGSEKINPAVAGAGTVNITPVLEYIDRITKPGVMSKVTEESTLALPEVKATLKRARELLANGEEMRTGASDLHDIQKSLRRQSYSLMKSPNPGDREIGNALLGVRNQIVDAIDKVSPQLNGKGTYKPALEGYRDEMHIADAFKKGHDDIFTSSKKMETDPSFVKKWFDGLTDHEKKAAKEGARAAIYTEMGAAKNGALAGESVARSEFNQAKMEILFGKDEAQKLFNKLAIERAIANTHTKVVEGSQTAMRSASKEGRALPVKNNLQNAVPYIAEAAGALTTGIPAVGTAAYQGLRVVNSAAHAVKTKIANEINARYATYALPTEGPSRDELIRQLEARIPGPKQSLVTRSANSLTRLVSP